MSAAYPTRGRLARRLRGRTLLANVGDDPATAYARVLSATDARVTRKILSGDLRARLHGYDPATVIRDVYARSDAPDPLGRILQTDLQTYLVTDILTKVDRASMAASLEVRCPLLDHRLVELVASIPSALKLRQGQSKWILRQAVAGRVPARC